MLFMQNLVYKNNGGFGGANDVQRNFIWNQRAFNFPWWTEEVNWRALISDVACEDVKRVCFSFQNSGLLLFLHYFFCFLGLFLIYVE